MPRSEDVTERELAKVSGPGEKVKLVQSAKPATKLTPSLQEMLDRWNSQSDKSLGFTSNVLAYGFKYTKPREHTNLIRLIKGGKLRVCQVDAPPPPGSNAKSASPFADRYFIVREACSSEVAEGTLTGRKRR
jgi:hypothetical protein